jgi:hypothetical protein
VSALDVPYIDVRPPIRSDTGPCRVVETRPSDSKIVIVGNKAYKTRAEADKEQMVIRK